MLHVKQNISLELEKMRLSYDADLWGCLNGFIQWLFDERCLSPLTVRNYLSDLCHALTFFSISLGGGPVFVGCFKSDSHRLSFIFSLPPESKNQ